MADEQTIRRFDQNDPISQGVGNNYLQMDDVLVLEHMTGDNEDKKLLLKQVQVIPQLYVASFSSSNIGAAECLNYSSFSPLLGQTLDITFGANYTGTATPSLSFGGLTLPIKAQGVSVGKGFNTKSGTNKRSFKATIKTSDTTAAAVAADTSKAHWFIDLDSDIVSVIDGAITHADGVVTWADTKINSALANYHPTIAKSNVSSNNVKKDLQVLNCKASNTKLLYKLSTGSNFNSTGYMGSIVGYRGSANASPYVICGNAVLYQAYNMTYNAINGTKGTGTFKVGICKYNDEYYYAIQSGADSRVVLDGLFFDTLLDTDVQSSDVTSFIENEWNVNTPTNVILS